MAVIDVAMSVISRAQALALQVFIDSMMESLE